MAIDPQIRGADAHDAVEATATTSEGESPFSVTQVIYIYNPGPNTVRFNFDAATTARGAFTVEATETWGPVPRTCANLHYKALSGTQAFRAFGLRGPS